MRVLGVDPGSRVTGLAVVEEVGQRFQALHYEGLRLKGGDSFPDRMWVLAKRLEELVHRFQPDQGAIEEAFVQKNVQSALKLGQVRGAVMVTFSRLGLSMGEYAPTRIKQSLTGYGRADKGQVQGMVKHILGLATLPTPNDAADALAVGICHIMHSGRSSLP